MTTDVYRFSVIPRLDRGIQEKPELLDPGACPGHDPGFAGVTILMTSCEFIKVAYSKQKATKLLAFREEKTFVALKFYRENFLLYNEPVTGSDSPSWA